MALSDHTDFDAKAAALEELAAKGILTKREAEACVKTLERKEPVKCQVYKDKYVSIEYRGFEEPDYNARHLRLLFVIQNQSYEQVTVKARILVNGVIVKKDTVISRDIPGKSKIVEVVTIPYSTLKAIDVESAGYIKSVSFAFNVTDSKFNELSRGKKPVNVIVRKQD